MRENLQIMYFTKMLGPAYINNKTVMKRQTAKLKDK